MTDRELLELAAKAAGLTVITDAKERGLWVSGMEDEWNPIKDDGDALRLAVKLRLAVSAAGPAFIEVAIFKNGEAHTMFRDGTMDSGWNEDPYAATRRAIVRAAASIGQPHDENQ